jgi:tyrosinase
MLTLQIGVHGRPYVTWNNFPTPLVNNAGFCPHGSTLFGTWHRPYLAIYEQAWYLSVQEVINTFPSNQQTRWRNAARTLRMPYWDWALFPGSGQPTVPALIRDQTVTVTKPSGQVTIANPLYSYSWGSSLPSEMGGGPWSNFPSTLRRPVSNPTRSNNNEMSTRFNNIRVSLRDRVYGLFAIAGSTSWGFVSTSQIGARTAQNGNNPDSFESIHDAVHVTAGGESGGHMYYLDYSSFDPIFWLHHTNVDRLLAMFQVMSPNTWMANGRIPRNMAQWNAGEEKNSNSPLKPFTKNTNGDYFTSNDIKDTRRLNYVYEQTASNNRDTVWNFVRDNYGPRAATRKRDISGQYEGREYQEGDYNTVLSVVANKYALPGSYSVHCFIGSPSTNSTNTTVPYPTHNTTVPYPSNSTSEYSNSTEEYDFTDDPSYVGTYSVLGGTHASSGNDSLITEGCLPLTTALQGKQASGELKSLHPDDVEEYLAKNLHYKVIGPGNAEIPADAIPGLHIYVQSCPVQPNGDQPPSFGDYTKLPKCTIDKPAGEPYEHKLTPIEYVAPGNNDKYPEEPSPVSTSPPYPTGTIYWPLPEQENGYCVSKQTVEYVDEDGKLLYQEIS